MKRKFVMALDQGTTSSRSIIFDHEGNMVSMAQKEVSQSFPQAGWVEMDAMEIWSSQLAVATEAMAKVGIEPSQLAAIGITNQRETTLVWDRSTGKPVAPAIVWQCRRTAAMVEQLKKDGLEDYIREKTGLIPDAYFSASKLAWILDHVEGAREKGRQGNYLFGTVDSWLIWNLTGGKAHVTDRTNASRTMLYDIHRLCWDKKILDYFAIPENMLPEVKGSSCLYGETAAKILGGAVPIAGAAGDQQAALFGQCCFEKGQFKNTYGTGCFLLAHTGDEPVKSSHGLLTTIAADTGEKPAYALEGSVFVAGAVIQWLRDQLHLISSAKESETSCRAVENTGGVYLVPAFTGLGAPWWDPYARGTIVGLTRGTSKDHLVRAAVESMAYQTADVIRAMEQDARLTAAVLKVDGGACANDFLMQFQADLLGARVQRPACIETTALGAAALAGLAVGFWKDKKELETITGIDRVFDPVMEDDVKRDLLVGWEKAIGRAKEWEE